MTEILLLVLAGGFVGFLVGLTGVGGGSLMTPLLLLFGFPPHIAIGTDLLYASITKASGVYSHSRHSSINWRLVGVMASGSIPASILTTIVLSLWFSDASQYAGVLVTSLGVMLILTSIVLLYRTRLLAFREGASWFSGIMRERTTLLTFSMGVFLGVFVTLTSVGAGAIGTAVLMVLYPHLTGVRIVGTDLAHAVPLTLVAGLGHMQLGNIDYTLLLCLLIGSLPATHLGTKLGKHMPSEVLRPVLATMLLLLGLKYAFF
ncbi:MAG: hypothetical protein CME36_08955 [unclassified Hahellaceae]|nr:hypothetical protein [Hahellaceae bacterium]